MPRLITANANGIRAAAKRGGLHWLAAAEPDVICLQEVRCNDAILAQTLADSPLADYAFVSSPSAVKPGHSGVAILSKLPILSSSDAIGGDEFDGQGRWIQADLQWTQDVVVTVASTYVHTGASEGPAKEEKDRFLAAVGAWMAGSDPAIVAGDINVAHTEMDMKNWRANRGHAGFLESERAHLTGWFDPERTGWADLGRRFGGPGPGPYTWWSWRGRGFDTDGGWRIDLVMASPLIAERAEGVLVGKAATYAERWSDHAPVVAEFA